LKNFHPHLLPPNYQSFNSLVGATPAPGAAQPSSVVYLPGQVQEPPLANSEFLEQWN
jgi:hypothetical protein